MSVYHDQGNEQLERIAKAVESIELILRYRMIVDRTKTFHSKYWDAEGAYAYSVSERDLARRRQLQAAANAAFAEQQAFVRAHPEFLLDTRDTAEDAL